MAQVSVWDGLSGWAQALEVQSEGQGPRKHAFRVHSMQGTVPRGPRATETRLNSTADAKLPTSVSCDAAAARTPKREVAPRWLDRLAHSRACCCCTSTTHWVALNENVAGEQLVLAAQAARGAATLVPKSACIVAANWTERRAVTSSG